MRKGVVIILAVAIIGALGVHSRTHNSSASVTMAGSGSSGSNATLGTSTSASAPAANASYKDGTYTGSSQDTAYGTVQIAVVVSGGKISGVNFLQMPHDLGNSQQVTAYAEPLLKQETLQKQSSHIDFVSGATQTSAGYQQSLQAALDQAA